MVPGQQFDISSAEDGVPFDLDGDGKLEHVAWPVDTKDIGFLFLDSGQDNNGRNLFGNKSSQPENTSADEADGFKALSQWDDPMYDHGKIVGPKDGLITSNDGVWNLLRFWFDLNRDGVIQQEEKKTLQELGIRALELKAVKSQRRDGNENKLCLMARFWKEGDPRPYFMVDYWAKVVPLN
jgi:hypothetical protein